MVGTCYLESVATWNQRWERIIRSTRHRHLIAVTSLLVVLGLLCVSGLASRKRLIIAVAHRQTEAFRSGGANRLLYTSHSLFSPYCRVQSVRDLRYELADEFSDPKGSDSSFWDYSGLNGYQMRIGTLEAGGLSESGPCLCACQGFYLVAEPINGVFIQAFDRDSSELRFLLRQVDFSAFCQNLASVLVYGQPPDLEHCHCQNTLGQECPLPERPLVGLVGTR